MESRSKTKQTKERDLCQALSENDQKVIEKKLEITNFRSPF